MSLIAVSLVLGATVASSAATTGEPTTLERATQSVRAQSEEVDALAEMVTSTTESHLRGVASERTEALSVRPVSDQDERGFMEKHFPIMLDDELHPDVEDNLLMLWLGTACLGCFAGPLWIPSAVVGLDPGPEYTGEALVVWLIAIGLDVAAWLVGLALAFTGVGSIIGIILGLVNSIYLLPVSTINSYNYHVLYGDDAPPARKKKKRRKKKKKLKKRRSKKKVDDEEEVEEDEDDTSASLPFRRPAVAMSY